MADLATRAAALPLTAVFPCAAAATAAAAMSCDDVWSLLARRENLRENKRLSMAPWIGPLRLGRSHTCFRR